MRTPDEAYINKFLKLKDLENKLILSRDLTKDSAKGTIYLL